MIELGIELDRPRTHTCGDLKRSDIGTFVNLKGWVHRRRDHGGLIFIDLRDRYGLTQVVFRPEEAKEAHQQAEKIRNEFVITVCGEVAERPTGTINPTLTTGEIEIVANKAEILSEAKTLPFSIEEETEVAEVVRLKYRYLDLRRPELQKNLLIRHKLVQTIRQFLERSNFVDIETPFLTKSTPEGARDYLVPSRLYPGKFYALPQSPQLFKQLLMMAGLDRYYQVVRCFRDEDLRRDRQPEFTQLDLEMSFATEELLFDMMEKMFMEIWKNVLGQDLKIPFPRISYGEAMERFSSDKPDLRWPIELQNLTTIFKETQFNVFRNVLVTKGEIRGFRIKGGNQLSRSQMEELTEKAKAFGAKGLVWFKEGLDKRSCSIEKFLSEKEMSEVAKSLDLQKGDLGLIIGDKHSIVRACLDSLRSYCVELMKIPATQPYAFTWIHDFPLFEYMEEEKRFVSKHHPFTSPHPEDLHLLMPGKDLSKIRARAYDLVLNGYEVGGGSIRIHTSGLQQKIFDCLNLPQEEARRKFGFFMEALEYGTPPHGGIAFGIDRIAMILAGTNAIRDVIAFPKTQSALDLMMEAPSEADLKQLKELSIAILKPNK